MAKKYLLYIHDMRFELEPEKSKLINNLLASHYGGVGVAIIQGVKLDSPKGREIERNFEFCKHNAVLGMCKKGCR